MRVKKIVSLVLTATMAMGLMAGCGLGAKDSDEQSKSSTTQVTAAPTEESVASETPATEEKTSSNGKVLVVYYSATGTTKAVAQSLIRQGAIYLKLNRRSHIQTMILIGQTITVVSAKNMMMRACAM